MPKFLCGILNICDILIRNVRFAIIRRYVTWTMTHLWQFVSNTAQQRQETNKFDLSIYHWIASISLYIFVDVVNVVIVKVVVVVVFQACYSVVSRQNTNDGVEYSITKGCMAPSQCTTPDQWVTSTDGMINRKCCTSSNCNDDVSERKCKPGSVL